MRLSHRTRLALLAIACLEASASPTAAAPPCSTHVEAARRLVSAGRHAEAAEAASLARRTCGTDGSVLRLQAETLSWSGRWREAAEPLTRALEAEPDAVWARALLGRHLSWRGRWVGAERHLRRALALDAGHAPARIGLAELLSWTDRPGEAEGLLLGLPESDPEVGGVRASLARLRGATAALDISRLDDARPARLDRTDVEVGWTLPGRRHVLELQASAGRHHLREREKPTDLQPTDRELDGARGRVAVRARWRGRYSASAELGALALEGGTLVPWAAEAAWLAHPASKTRLSLALRRRAEDFTVPAAAAGITRRETALRVDAAPWRLTLRADVSRADHSDGNGAIAGSAWWLVDALRRPRLQLSFGHAYARQRVDEYRYELRGASSTADGAGYRYDLDGEFTYWTPRDHWRHEVLARLWLRVGRWDLELGGSRAFADATTLPFLYPEVGPTETPDPESMQVGSYRVEDERPFSWRARVGVDLPGRLHLQVRFQRVSSIFYDHDTWSVGLRRAFGGTGRHG